LVSNSLCHLELPIRRRIPEHFCVVCRPFSAKISPIWRSRWKFKTHHKPDQVSSGNPSKMVVRCRPPSLPSSARAAPPAPIESVSRRVPAASLSMGSFGA
jgi:hypothetical protein